MDTFTGQAAMEAMNQYSRNILNFLQNIETILKAGKNRQAIQVVFRFILWQ